MHIGRAVFGLAFLAFCLSSCDETDDALLQFTVSACRDMTAPPDSRISACTQLLKSGKLTAMDEAEMYNNRGSAYRQSGDTGRAAADYDRAIELQPGYLDGIYNRGVLFSDIRQYDRAIAAFDRAIAIDPKYAAAYLNRGLTFHMMGDLSRAIVDDDKAIALSPNNAFAYKNRGHVYIDLGDYQRALTDLNRAIDENPAIASAFDLRGHAFFALGEYAKAVADFDHAIQLMPDIPDSYNNEAWLLATAPRPDVRNGAEAVRLAQRAVALDDHPSYKDTLAAALAEKGDFAAAVRTMEDAINGLRALGETEAIDRYKARLALYRAGKPYRQ